MAKNIVVRKKVGDKWVELHPATNAGNVAMIDGKTVQAKVDELNAQKADKNSVYNKNGFINSFFDVWQRGTSFDIPAGVAKYTADCWSVAGEGTSVSVIRANGGLNANQLKMIIKEDGNLSSNLRYNFEKSEFSRFRNRVITVSIDMWTDTPFTNVFAWFSDVGSPEAEYTDQVQTIQATRRTYIGKFKLTGDLDSLKKLHLQVIRNATPNWKGNIKVHGVKWEFGEVATPMIPPGVGEELVLCQRYYEKSYAGNYVEGSATEHGQVTFTAVTSEWLVANFRFQVRKHIIPTMKVYDRLGNIGINEAASGNVIQTSKFELSRISENGIYAIKTDAVLKEGMIYAGQFIADASI